MVSSKNLLCKGNNVSSCSTVVKTTAATGLTYPTLERIIANESDHPYTLANFKKYLSNLHCEEPLDFLVLTNDFNRSYQRLSVFRSDEEEEAIRVFYNEIVNNFLLESSTQELNIHQHIKEKFRILDCSDFVTDDDYNHLQQAIEEAKDIIEENNYMSFIHSCYQQRDDSSFELSLNNTYNLQHHVKGHGRGYSFASNSHDKTSPSIDTQIRHSALPAAKRNSPRDSSSDNNSASPTSFWADSIIHIPRIKRTNTPDIASGEECVRQPLLKRMSGKFKLR